MRRNNRKLGGLMVALDLAPKGRLVKEGTYTGYLKVDGVDQLVTDRYYSSIGAAKKPSRNYRLRVFVNGDKQWSQEGKADESF